MSGNNEDGNCGGEISHGEAPWGAEWGGNATTLPARGFEVNHESTFKKRPHFSLGLAKKAKRVSGDDGFDMDVVKLERHEAETGALPAVCMRCGQPATWRRGKLFKRVFGKEIEYRIVAPLCHQHKNHWFWRDLLIPVSLALAVIAPCAGAWTLPPENKGFGIIAGLASLLVWCICASIAHLTSIRAQEITDTSVTLRGVSPVFADALREHRSRAKEFATHDQQMQPLLQGVGRRQICLSRATSERGLLPPVCTYCGQSATVSVIHKFSWNSREILIPFIGFYTETLYADAAIPFCERHKNHWRSRSWAGLGGFVCLVLLIIGALCLLSVIPPDEKKMRGSFLLGILLIGIVCLIAGLIAHLTRIRAKEISEQSLTITGVSDAFVQAMNSVADHPLNVPPCPIEKQAPTAWEGVGRFCTFWSSFFDRAKFYLLLGAVLVIGGAALLYEIYRAITR
jgi:hypothetical protein